MQPRSRRHDTRHPHRMRASRPLPLVWLLVSLGLLGGAAQAATFTVTKTADTNDGACAADCSLREAVAAANAAGGDDTVTLPAGTYTLTLGELGVTQTGGAKLTLNGAGAASTIIQAGTTPTNGVDRVFEVLANANLVLSGLTIRHGKGTVNGGGGILNNQSGTVTVQNCTLSLNSTTSGGGGISNRGTLTVQNSTLSLNSTTSLGGGIFNDSGTLTVQNSTLSLNSAANGGGIYNLSQGTFTVQNSTLSQNSASSGGGGIFHNTVNKSATVQNSTLSQNSAPTGGGIYNNTHINMNLGNNILYKGSASGENLFSPGGVTSQGANLSSDGTGPNNGTTDQINTDPRLDPAGLVNNGGPTQTIALLPGSPALNAGSNSLAASAGITTDQRGISRPQQSTVDIGAFESRGFTLAKVAGDNQSAKVNTAFATVLGVTVSSSFGEPVNGGQITFTPPVSGASASLSPNPATITTIISGAASSTATANGTAGAYSVSANASGAAAPVSFSLTNLATLSINDVAANEGNSGTTTFSFTVTRSGDTSGTVTVHYSTSGGTATAGSDYTAIPDTTLTFAPTQATKTIDVTVAGDQGREPDETFNVTLSNPTGIVIATATGIGTILNDDSGLVVTTISDIINGNDNDNSLREAVIIANAIVGDNTITLAAGTYTLSLAGTDEDAAATGDLDVTQAGAKLTINGAGAASTIIQAGTTPTNGIDRVFEVLSSANLTLSGLTIRYGKFNGNGGGIFNNTGGTLTVNNSTLSQNSAPNGYGGGLYNFGTATVNNCTLSSNSAAFLGGGILNNTNDTLMVQNSTLSNNVTPDGSGGGLYNDGTATVNNSTLSQNSALATNGIGGGIFNDSNGTLTVNNSTLSLNFTLATNGNGGGGIYTQGNPGTTVTVNNSTLSQNSSQYGGGIDNEGGGLVTVNNSTLSQNSAPNGGGIYNNFGTVKLGNSILHKGSGSGVNFANNDTLNSQGFNLSSDGTGPNNGTTDKINTDPRLDPAGLVNNGGLTQTIALLPGSPALNAGSNSLATSAGITTDQRGISRPQQGTVDIGAFESRGFTLAKAAGDNQSAKINTAFVTALGVTISSSFGEPVNGGQITFTPPVSGASAGLSPNPATISSAAVSSTATANGTAGSYSVSANASGAAAAVTFTLTNAPTGVSINTVTANEGDSGTTTFTFTVTRSGDLSGTSTVHYSTSDGTATAGSDYAAIGDTTLTFTPTQTTKFIDVSVTGDQGREPNETFNLMLSNPSAGTAITTATGLGTILNDDSGLIVTTNLDTFNGNDSDNSLREAVIAANAAAGNDTITLPAGTYTLTLAGINEDAGATGDLDVTQTGGAKLTINGAGAASTIIQAGTTPTNGIDRVFDVLANANLALSALTIRHGKAIDGGGISNLGTLAVNNSTLSQNSATSQHGGGISNFGTVTVNNSTLGQNSAAVRGGGLSNFNGSTATVNNSTLSQNSATSGGGLFNFNGSTLTVNNSTLSQNSATNGGGIVNFGTVNLGNTILHQGSGTGVNLANFGTLTSQGTNLSSDGTGANNGTTDQINTDPLLDPAGLADNGGPTQTIKLRAGSPAIDQGNALGSATTDQRGRTRPVDLPVANAGGDGSDIGAFEVQLQTGPGFVVTSSADPGGGVCTEVDCTLRAAITAANNHANSGGADTISFAIAGTAPFTISPTSALPNISEAVVINGTTQPGYTDHPLVQIDGTNAGAGVNGLTVQSSGSTVRGLALGRFGGAGVLLAGSGGQRVERCYLGTFYNGPAVSTQTAAPNATGALVASSGNVLGLALNDSGAANRIWTNSGDGVQVNAAAQGNVMRGNTFRDNGDQPIDLNGDGLTFNDLDAADDGDSGANGLQNFPVLTNVMLAFNANTMIQGTLQSKLDRDYRLDFYRSSSSGGVAQPGWIGTFYLGSSTVHTSAADGTASFNFDTGATSSGVYYGATATDVATGDTSEFSALSFQDGTKPTISITAPNPAGGVLPAGQAFPQIQGTATDNLPGVTVRLHLKRLSDGLYWDGTTWGAPQTNLPTSPPSGVTGTWHSTGNLPLPPSANPVTLLSNQYQIVAYAIDVAGNQLAAAKTLSYDLHLPTVSIDAPGTPGQAANSLVNIMALSSVSGAAANPGVGMKKVLLRLVRSSDNKQWNGANWVVASPAVSLATSPADLSGASPAAWSKSSGWPTVGSDVNTQLQVGKLYNLSAVSYDQLNQASNGFLLRLKVVSVLSVSRSTLPPSGSETPGSESPSE